MNWRALAFFFWVLAAALAGWQYRVLAQAGQPAYGAEVSVVPRLQLWPGTSVAAVTRMASPRPVAPVQAAAPAEPEQVPAAPATVPVASSESVVADEKGCARLGKFPTRAWATQVADILTRPAAGEPVTHVLQGTDETGYFVILPSWSAAHLTEVMAQRQNALHHWVTSRARAEACKPGHWPFPPLVAPAR